MSAADQATVKHRGHEAQDKMPSYAKRQATLLMEGQEIVKVPQSIAKHWEEDTKAFQLSFGEDQFKRNI